MACPKCGCKETYQYDDGDDCGMADDNLERCAACGEIFDREDEAPEDDEDQDQPAVNYVFCTGLANPFHADAIERRFWVVPRALRWKKQPPLRKAQPASCDCTVLIGPHWQYKQDKWSYLGARERVQGRWLSAIWASRIRWVSKSIKHSQGQRRAWRLSMMRSRIKERFTTSDKDLPF
jgi:hypothetical protein